MGCTLLEGQFAFAVTAFYNGTIFSIEIVNQSNGLMERNNA